MPDATYIACPRCGEPYAMTAMQKRLFHGRTLTCQRCAKPFEVTEATPDPVPAPEVRRWTPPADPVRATPVAPKKPALPKGEGLTAARMAVLIAFAAGAIAFILYAAVAPSVHRSREAARRATCTSNLAQIGQALMLYANSHRGQFPDGLDALVANGSVPAEMLVCPSSKHTPAGGRSPADQAANLPKGSHLSYVYAGKGLSFIAAKRVLAYEPLDHHDGEGVNVLFSDGTAQFLPRTAAFAAIPELAPPGTPTTAPTATQPATAPAALPGS